MGNLMDREINSLTPERMKEILQKQREIENKNLERLKSEADPRMRQQLKPGEIPAMPRYGEPVEEKSPEEKRMDALLHLQNRQESEALSEAKRKRDEEAEEGYTRRGGSR